MEDGIEKASPVKVPAHGEPNIKEQVAGVLETGTPLQQEVSGFVETVAGPVAGASPVRISSLEVASALTLPDSSHIEGEPAARITLEVTAMPEGFTQAFIIGSTLDGGQARLISSTCAIINERLSLCGDAIARVGSEDDGGVSGMVYALGDLLGANAFAGIDRGSDGTITGFWELGKTLDIPGSDISVTGGIGGFGPDEYGRLALEWATRRGIDLRLEVFVPEAGSSQGTITFVKRF